MSALTEATHPFEFLQWELNRDISREEVTVKSGQNLSAGDVIGKITCGAATATARAGNTGTGAMGAVTKGTKVIPGDYLLTIVDAVTNAGVFRLYDPNGKVVGEGNVAAAFTSDHLNFTLADATDFIVGDSFTITVAAGSGKCVLIDPEAVDGSAVAFGIIGADCDASLADKTAIAVVRSAVVSKDLLGFSDADAGEITTIIAQLKAITSGPIIVKETLS